MTSKADREADPRWFLLVGALALALLPLVALRVVVTRARGVRWLRVVDAHAVSALEVDGAELVVRRGIEVERIALASLGPGTLTRVESLGSFAASNEYDAIYTFSSAGSAKAAVVFALRRLTGDSAIHAQLVARGVVRPEMLEVTAPRRLGPIGWLSIAGSVVWFIAVSAVVRALFR